MTNWPEAIALAFLALCALGAWVAWLKWGQKPDHTGEALKGLQEPTWQVTRTWPAPWSQCTCGQSSNLPCPVHNATGDVPKPNETTWAATPSSGTEAQK